MAYLPIRHDAPSFPVQTRQHARGHEVLTQMFAYFDYDDLPFIAQDDQADYARAA